MAVVLHEVCCAEYKRSVWHEDRGMVKERPLWSCSEHTSMTMSVKVSACSTVALRIEQYCWDSTVEKVST